MRVGVRNPGGLLLGEVDLCDAKRLLRPMVSFARAINTRYYGVGLREIPDAAEDLSFQRVDMKVGTFATQPRVNDEGVYTPGRLDFCLLWDGPTEALRDVPAFEAARSA